MGLKPKLFNDTTGKDALGKTEAFVWFASLPDVFYYQDGDRVGLAGVGDYTATTVNPVGPVRAWVLTGAYATTLQVVTDNGNTTTSDIIYSNSTNGPVSTSADTNQWRRTVGNDGVTTLTDTDATGTIRRNVIGIDTSANIIAIAEANITDGTRLYNFETKNWYTYDATLAVAAVGDLTPADQTGGTGFWVADVSGTFTEVNQPFQVDGTATNPTTLTAVGLTDNIYRQAGLYVGPNTTTQTTYADNNYIEVEGNLVIQRNGQAGNTIGQTTATANAILGFNNASFAFAGNHGQNILAGLNCTLGSTDTCFHNDVGGSGITVNGTGNVGRGTTVMEITGDYNLFAGQQIQHVGSRCLNIGQNNDSGAAATQTGTLNNAIIGSQNSYSINGQLTNSIVVGINHNADGSQMLYVGNAITGTTTTTNSLAFGATVVFTNANTAGVYGGQNSNYDSLAACVTVGTALNVTSCTGSDVVGNTITVTGSTGTSVRGGNHNVSGSTNSGVFGDSHTVTDADRMYFFGNDITCTDAGSTNVLAIGAAIDVGKDGQAFTNSFVSGSNISLDGATTCAFIGQEINDIGVTATNPTGCIWVGLRHNINSSTDRSAVFGSDTTIQHDANFIVNLSGNNGANVYTSAQSDYVFMRATNGHQFSVALDDSSGIFVRKGATSALIRNTTVGTSIGFEDDGSAINILAGTNTQITVESDGATLNQVKAPGIVPMNAGTDAGAVYNINALTDTRVSIPNTAITTAGSVITLTSVPASTESATGIIKVQGGGNAPDWSFFDWGAAGAPNHAGVAATDYYIVTWITGGLGTNPTATFQTGFTV